MWAFAFLGVPIRGASTQANHAASPLQMRFRPAPMSRLTGLKPRINSLHARTTALTTSTARTRGSRWMAIRKRVMTRDGGLCVHCRRAGRVTLGEEVDHITPLERGGTDNESNLQLLCKACHCAKSAADQSRRGSHAPRP